jgi:hypothetical protein
MNLVSVTDGIVGRDSLQPVWWSSLTTKMPTASKPIPSLVMRFYWTKLGFVSFG